MTPISTKGLELTAKLLPRDGRFRGYKGEQIARQICRLPQTSSVEPTMVPFPPFDLKTLMAVYAKA